MMLIESPAPAAAAGPRSQVVAGRDRTLGAERALTPWACGCSDDVGACDDERCADIVPELIIELL